MEMLSKPAISLKKSRGGYRSKKESAAPAIVARLLKHRRFCDITIEKGTPHVFSGIPRFRQDMMS